ncbi:c-x8-c-x5-c-x3-h type zinc finger protein [Diplodia corticola]|uniref:C-x8-c-x5-c-x3-h type zinc finger protein n=1 Tax=Diplodia corticola TaxID=236234 RepID=A0A1J9RZ80_9PEZI|nr:c-x8-c-x5-c-x3-h type zinc finger protein [Diplodia corticola]OJD32757.1 c-x8-c-x5-c-x3-h type zinc finger protein [Diplodia corticola]
MASNHVHLDDHHAGQQSNMFARPELNTFDNLFTNAHTDQAFDASAWNFEQQGAAPPQWQQQTHQQPMPATFDSSGAFYAGRDFSNSPAPYGNQAFADHGAVAPQFQQNNVDPALMSSATADHPNFNNSNMRMYATSAAQASTIAPQALQSARQASYGPGTPPVADFQQSQQRQSSAAQQPILASTPPASVPVYVPAPPAKYPDAPAGKPSGKFYIIDANELATSTNSMRLHEFLYIGNDAIEMPIMKSSLPQYQARKSRNELRKLAANDERLRAKIAKASKKAKTPAAKIARTRPISFGSPSSLRDEISDSSSEEETSEDDSDYESSDDETPEPSPLPGTRPNEALPAMRYDTIKATWRPRNLPVTADEIRAALKDYWDILQAVRNRWKEDQSALKLAQEKNSRDIELLKGRVKDQRSLMEMAMKCALEHGHPDVIRVLGGNAPLLFLAYQFLADRIRENEYNDPFSKTIIELLSRSENITMENIERTKLNTALKRYLNRGDERTKPRAEKILERAQANSKKSGPTTTNGASEKKPEVKKEADPSKEIKGEPGTRSQPLAVAGVKRPRPSDSSAQQPAKKITSAAAPSTAMPAGAKTAVSGLKKPGATTTTSSANGAALTAAKSKMMAKPNMFAGLQSASKRSSVTVQKPTAGTTAAPKKPAAPASAAPRFSFAETMANLTKPKEQQPASKPEESRPPETEEERAKRLRKEERRKLRVKWADNGLGNKDQLESVRLFTHDPEEELGHDAAMVRDVADVGGEGRMFKQHKDMMDLDDDDDRPSEEDFYPWHAPSLVDFSSVPAAERERNYEPYGGGVLSVDSPEKAVQEQHEANTLLVFYTSPGDIPPCPREPPEDEQRPHPDAKEPFIGMPPGESPYTERAKRHAPPPPPAPPADIPMPDLSSIMSILSRTQQQQAPTPPQPPQPPQIPQPAPQTSELERTFSMFMPPQQPQQPPQVSQPQPQPPASTAPPSADIQAILASLGNLTGQAQAPQPPQPAQQPPPAQFPGMAMNAGGTPGFDLAAILQSVGNGGAPPAVPAFGMPLPSQQAQQQNPHQPLPSQSELFQQEERTKRQRGPDDHGGDRGWGNQRRNKKWKNKKDPDYQPPQFVVPCKFWKEGKCMKGDKCPVHSSSSASTKPPAATASPPPTAPTAPKSMTVPQGGSGGKKKKKRKGKRYMDRDANGGDLGAGIMDD